MVIPDTSHYLPWVDTNIRIRNLGAPSSVALQSMCIGLSIVIEYIFYTEEQYKQSIGRLTLTSVKNMSISTGTNNELMSNRDSLYSSSQVAVKYPLWKKVCYILLAIIYSLIVGVAEFFIADHSMDQIIFGWLLGAWLAVSYFALIREHVHHHVTDLTTGQTTSGNYVYYLLSIGIWLSFMTIATTTFLVNKDKSIEFPNDDVPKNPLWSCIEKFDYWNTWINTAYMSAGLGGYFGIIHQHKKYGGQLFIQQKIDQLRKSKVKRFVLRLLIIVGLGLPQIILTVIIY